MSLEFAIACLFDELRERIRVLEVRVRRAELRQLDRWFAAQPATTLMQ